MNLLELLHEAMRTDVPRVSALDWDMSRVLLIDDEHFLLSRLEQTLLAAGFEVLIAASADEGVALARAFTPDLIVLDRTLPKVKGTFPAEVLRRAPETASIPLIFLSRRPKMKTVRTRQSASLHKPFRPSQLLELVRSRLAEPHQIGIIPIS